MLSISNIFCDDQTGNERLRYGHVPEPYDTPTDPTPRPVVVWAVTKACNLRCVHCYASADPHASPSELTHEQGVTLLDDLKDFGVPAVLFSGGEPLARPDTPELIGYARSIGLNCTLSTNGLLIDDAMADRLLNLGLKYAGISVDGTPARHDKLRGRVGAYDGTVAAIDRCRERGIKVGVRFTVHALNRDDLDAIIDLCLEHDVQRLCVYHLAYAGRGGKMQKVDLTADQTRDVVDTIIDRTRAAHGSRQALEVLTVGNHADAAYALMRLEHEAPDRAREVWPMLRGTGGNRSGCNVASIDPLGNIHYDQFSWHYDCGNVKQELFSRIWTEATDPRLAILRDRKSHLPRRCQTCRFLNVCNGNLRTRAEAATGDWLGQDPSCYLTDAEIHAADIPSGGASTAKADAYPHLAGATHTITSRVTNPPLELEVTNQAFQPNPTTVRFSRAVKVHRNELVFDIGTGVGPLALMAAKGGARQVIAVDPVPLHVQLAKRNVEKYGLNDIVQVYEGSLYEPFQQKPWLQNLRADVIIGDVSGIADTVARALNWYSDAVPTGGYDGTEVIIPFLEQTPRHLAPGGRVYFPIAVDLSYGEKILDAVYRIFSSAHNALNKPYVEFPLGPGEIRAIHAAYHGELPPFIHYQDGDRPFWRGQIWTASDPR